MMFLHCFDSDFTIVQVVIEYLMNGRLYAL